MHQRRLRIGNAFFFNNCQGGAWPKVLSLTIKSLALDSQIVYAVTFLQSFFFCNPMKESIFQNIRTEKYSLSFFLEFLAKESCRVKEYFMRKKGKKIAPSYSRNIPVKVVLSHLFFIIYTKDLSNAVCILILLYLLGFQRDLFKIIFLLGIFPVTQGKK